MPDRAALIRAFLVRAGWDEARRQPLAGDAGNRRYERLARGRATAVLMDAPPVRGEDVRPFLRIGRYLVAAGLSAPRILAEDAEAGLLLLEDLGDALFARVILADPALEPDLYAAAVDVLSALHEQPPPAGTTAFDSDLMVRQAALVYDWYPQRPATAGGAPPSTARAAFAAEFADILDAALAGPDVTILRDYHAENLIWLPGRAGIARVGLLDFQDAMRGHPAYDLVSLLLDARRDVPAALEREMRARFVRACGADPDGFDLAYAALGVQRNLRILGVFARLSLHYGKPHYVDLIPRVWGHLQASLHHPALSGLARRIERDLPCPDPGVLRTLKERCATVPTP